MKRQIRYILQIILIATFICCGFFCSSFATTTPRNGWSGDCYYRNGTKVAGLQKIKGRQYYFNPKAGRKRVRDKVIRIKGKYYYFNKKTGAKLTRAKFFTSHGYRYRSVKGGALSTGLRKINGKYYYFYPKNARQARNKIIKTKKGVAYYYRKSDGVRVTKAGFINLSGKYYYVRSGGALAKGVRKIDGKYYCFDKSTCVMARNKLVETDGKIYIYRGSDGARIVNEGWVTSCGLRYYVGQGGAVIAEPEKPQLRAVNGEGYHKLCWDEVKGAVGYLIYSFDGSEWRLAADNGDGRDVIYIDKAPEHIGKEYRYSVIAYSNLGFSEESYVDAVISELPVPVIRSLEIAEGGEAAVLRWYPEASAESYLVYTRLPEETEWSLIGETDKTSMEVPYGDRGRERLYSVAERNGALVSPRDQGFSAARMCYNEVNELIEGSSIARDTNNKQGGYLDIAARLLGINAKNSAHGGSKVVSCSGASVLNRVRNAELSQYDLYVFNTGVNDYTANTPLGAMDSTDPTTYCGAWNEILKSIRTANPDAAVVLTVSIDSNVFGADMITMKSEKKNAEGLTASAYKDVIRKMADKYDCYVYDMEGKYVDRSNLWETTYDNIHPNRGTHRAYGYDFAEWLIGSGALNCQPGDE